MIEPYQLIGLPYRLGADPEKHGATDCLNLCRAVLHWQGITTPTPRREWYRRLRRGDRQVFEEELSRWGEQCSAATVGTIGLLTDPEQSCGLAAFYEDGWLQFSAIKTVIWVPSTGLTPAALYCRLR